MSIPFTKAYKYPLPIFSEHCILDNYKSYSGKVSRNET